MRKFLGFIAICAIVTFPAEYIMDNGDSRSENLVVTAVLAVIGVLFFLLRNKIAPQKKEEEDYKKFWNLFRYH